MTGRAEIRVANRNGMFVADTCTIDRPYITATGSWRRRLATGDRYSERRTYTWSAREVREVRWQRDEVAA